MADVLELLLGSDGDGRGQECVDQACFRGKARLRWFGEELRRDKRYQWKDAEERTSKQEARRRSTEEIYGWKEERMHRIGWMDTVVGVTKSVRRRRMKRRCTDHLSWNYMMHIFMRNLKKTCIQLHFLYTFRDSHEGCVMSKRAFSEQTWTRLLASQEQRAGWHLLGLRRELRTRQDAFVKQPEDKYRNQLIKPSTDTRSAPSVRLITLKTAFGSSKNPKKNQTNKTKHKNAAAG